MDRLSHIQPLGQADNQRGRKCICRTRGIHRFKIRRGKPLGILSIGPIAALMAQRDNDMLCASFQEGFRLLLHLGLPWAKAGALFGIWQEDKGSLQQFVTDPVQSGRLDYNFHLSFPSQLGRCFYRFVI